MSEEIDRDLADNLKRLQTLADDLDRTQEPDLAARVDAVIAQARAEITRARENEAEAPFIHSDLAVALDDFFYQLDPKDKVRSGQEEPRPPETSEDNETKQEIDDFMTQTGDK